MRVIQLFIHTIKTGSYFGIGIEFHLFFVQRHLMHTSVWQMGGGIKRISHGLISTCKNVGLHINIKSEKGNKIVFKSLAWMVYVVWMHSFKY